MLLGIPDQNKPLAPFRHVFYLQEENAGHYVKKFLYLPEELDWSPQNSFLALVALQKKRVRSASRARSPTCKIRICLGAVQLPRRGRSCQRDRLRFKEDRQSGLVSASIASAFAVAIGVRLSQDRKLAGSPKMKPQVLRGEQQLYPRLLDSPTEWKTLFKVSCRLPCRIFQNQKYWSQRFCPGKYKVRHIIRILGAECSPNSSASRQRRIRPDLDEQYPISNPSR